ncbi:MAG: L-histidine N(alpha)-methyltransferase [Pseudomonadota bacterium]
MRQPPQSDFGAAVYEGLSRARKAIDPKFFYDEKGSKLFDAICRQPEYYPPHAEREILTRYADEIAELAGRGCTLIEPGAGSAEKVRLFLQQLQPSAYVPLDISGDYLRQSAQLLSKEYPWLPIHAACIDFCHSLHLPETVPSDKRVVFFPGSSLGNFKPQAAIDFLTRVRQTVGTGGGLLIGIDTKKEAEVLNAAYNDRAGMTARFNLNLLERMQRELGARLQPEAFEHHAFYNSDKGRVEMHVVSRKRQVITINSDTFAFARDETIHTECSYKYRPKEFHRLAAEAGFEPKRVWLDSRELFSVHYLVAV